MFNSHAVTRDESIDFKAGRRVFVQRMVMTILVLFLVAGAALGQNLVIGTSATFSGSGTYHVKGSIDNSARSTAVDISGTVNLAGTSAQDVGNATKPAINFSTLKATGVSTKTFNVNSTVSTLIDVTAATTTKFDLSTKKLTVQGSITNSGAASTPFVFNGSGSEVDYSKTSGNQSLFGTTYDKLTLSGASTFDLSGDVTANSTVNHTGGALSVNNNFSAGAGYTIAAISTVAAGKALTLGTTGSISTLTDIAATGQLVNGSGALTVANLTDNHGTITASANGGAVTFTNAAGNNGAVTGGVGLVKFSSTLSTASGTMTAGSGGLQYDGVLTIASGSIAGGANSVDFNGNVDNQGTISLAASGQATFAGSFINSHVGTLSLNTASTWTYDGASQDVAGASSGVSYGNLDMAGSGTKTALGNIPVTGNFDNGGAGNAAITTDMSTFALSITGTSDNTNGTMKFGGAANGILFTTGTVDYNASSGTQSIAGHASNKYSTLLFSGGGTKQIAAATRVATSGNLTVNSGVTADVSASDSQLLVDGNLTVSGTVNNAGTVQVGP